MVDFRSCEQFKPSLKIIARFSAYLIVLLAVSLGRRRKEQVNAGGNVSRGN